MWEVMFRTERGADVDQLVRMHCPTAKIKSTEALGRELEVIFYVPEEPRDTFSSWLPAYEYRPVDGSRATNVVRRIV